MDFTPARQLEPDLWLLDLHFQGAPGVVAAYLITGPFGHTLIETGPGATIGALEHAIECAGVRLGDVTQLVVTHIHLDHAGAAGSLLRRLPEARLFVHPLGAQHMIDPSRLLHSAARIYGDRMDSLWGAFEPCPAHRVIELADDTEVRCGARLLRAVHTPGHAAHHITYYDAEHRTMFTGDVGGVRLQGATYVRPPTPPPDIDVEAWHRSVSRMRALEPAALDLTHFGRFYNPERHFEDLLGRLDTWTRDIASELAAGLPREVISASLKRRSDAEIAAEVPDPELARAYELATPTGMTVDGIARYLNRRGSST